MTYNIPHVEIFSAGTWNGDEYTIDDLHEMVKSFSETKQGIPPPLKLGHSDDQQLLEGMPAAGWVDDIYVVGDKLVANFVNIPKAIYELIVNKGYRKVSCEIFWNLKIGDKLYKRLLGAVALLGAETPGVMNLSDIMAMYKKLSGSEPPKIYANNALNIQTSKVGKKGSTMEKTALELKLEADLAEEKARLVKFSADMETATQSLKKFEQEVADLKKYKADAEERELKLAEETAKLKRESFMKDLEKELLCSKSMKPYVEALIGEEKKVYSIGKAELSKEDMIKEMLKLFKAAATVNFEESSVEGENDSEGEEKQIQEIEKYARDNKVSYAVAAKAILKNKK